MSFEAKTFESLVERARSLAAGAAPRRLLGIAGAPGSGKSTLAASLAAALGPELAVVVPMDGFHLAHAELERLGRVGRKGAPDTFDAAGFVALLARLRDAAEPVTYAPQFRREIEEPIAGAIPVPREVPLVIVEGNYLLVDHGAWSGVRALLDQCWFVEVDEAVRMERLVARHRAFGRAEEEARAFAAGSDQANAVVIAATRGRADAVVVG
ncbi:MAG: nucleoside/nucleotide kinase family protein [Demequinaceae bacterium]|nr:nucleoside/nucleotide kinase family protein [Demequinaceae bacterium]